MLKITVEEKTSIRKLVKRFDISLTTLFQCAKRLEVKTTRIKKATKVNMILLKKNVKENLNSYQYKRTDKFAVNQRCIEYVLSKLGVIHKKNVSVPKDEGRKVYYV